MEENKIPEAGNFAGDINKKTANAPVTKGNMTEVPKKGITHESAKANSQVTGDKIPFNKAQVTGNGTSA